MVANASCLDIDGSEKWYRAQTDCFYDWHMNNMFIWLTPNFKIIEVQTHTELFYRPSDTDRAKSTDENVPPIKEYFNLMRHKPSNLWSWRIYNITQRTIGQSTHAVNYFWFSVTYRVKSPQILSWYISYFVSTHSFITILNQRT